MWYELTTTATSPNTDWSNFPFISLNSTTNNGRNFPPYNVLEFKDGSVRLDLAVAGYQRERLQVELEENTLIVRGLPETTLEADVDRIIKQGIANTAWVRAFSINPNAKVDNVSLQDGILAVSLSMKEPPRVKTSFDIK